VNPICYFVNNYFQAFAKQYNTTPDDLDMHVIYDVSHNIAKIEEHIVDGKQKTLLVHRKVNKLYVLYSESIELGVFLLGNSSFMCLIKENIFLKHM